MCCEQEAIPPPGRPSEVLLTNGLIGAPVARRVADARGSSLVGILVENAVESTVAAAEQRSRGAGRQEEPEMVNTELKFTGLDWPLSLFQSENSSNRRTERTFVNFYRLEV